jgi:hypothetical protein
MRLRVFHRENVQLSYLAEAYKIAGLDAWNRLSNA